MNAASAAAGRGRGAATVATVEGGVGLDSSRTTAVPPSTVTRTAAAAARTRDHVPLSLRSNRRWWICASTSAAGTAPSRRTRADKLKGRFASDHCLTARGTSGQVLAKLPLIVRR